MSDSKTRVVYIAHPIGGNVQGNLRKIEAIVRSVNHNFVGVFPFVPYFADCMALDDALEGDRLRGMMNGRSCFERRMMDEVWLYGDGISSGMLEEIKLAIEYGIPVVPRTPGTSNAVEEMNLGLLGYETLDLTNQAFLLNGPHILRLAEASGTKIPEPLAEEQFGIEVISNGIIARRLSGDLYYNSLEDMAAFIMASIFPCPLIGSFEKEFECRISFYKKS